jgi:membrane protein implicated in regulation of membrane protease activity
MKPWIIAVVLGLVATVAITVTLYLQGGIEVPTFLSAAIFAVLAGVIWKVLHRRYVKAKTATQGVTHRQEETAHRT